MTGREEQLSVCRGLEAPQCPARVSSVMRSKQASRARSAVTTRQRLSAKKRVALIDVEVMKC